MTQEPICSHKYLSESVLYSFRSVAILRLFVQTNFQSINNFSQTNQLTQMMFLLLILVTLASAQSTPPYNEVVPRSEEELVTVLDFTDGFPIAFYSQNDGVMGGISSGAIVYDENEGAAKFSGDTVTDFNGGFSSVTSEVSPDRLQFPEKQGMRLFVKGDGRTYRVTAKNSAFYFTPNYNHDFTTKAGEYIYVELYFKDFLPQFFGELVDAREVLTSDNIVEIGFMHSKFTMYGFDTFEDWEEGEFELFIKSVQYF
eukprot:TRINITY_DN8938_c0_g1_i1.p1 TRINITY_DN8938_c0_g1~~TRINITY_DN8938_c0_g1_i1.p1  ORF type:complete len:256 (-),score=18.76 TRINITY_DN8938_c0_g1_i1:444-1211(-)